MEIEIEISPRPIEPRGEKPLAIAGDTGARAEFSGIVRSGEDGRAIAALEYEAYSPMAERVMHDIISEIGRQHPCLSVRVIHRIGVVAVGETAIYICATAQHRAEAFTMLTQFMNRLKQDVPIWKRRALNAAELAVLKNT